LNSARLRYSGIILVASKSLGVVTGMLFTMIVTRRLMVEEFGVWQYVTVLFSYFILPSSFTGFWITRHAARGEKLATTGLLLNMLFSIPSTMLFVIASTMASSVAATSPIFFQVISPQISLMYLLSIFEAVASGVKPQLLGYGSAFFEFAKIGIGAILVLNMRLGLIGALLSVEIAYALQVVFMAIMLREEFSRSFSKEAAKKWIMLAWIPLFSQLSFQMQQFDSIITTFITSSTIPIAMLKAAQVFTAVVSFSVYAASALYPRLLAGVGDGDIVTSIKLVSLLAIPSMFGALVLAEPLLAVLRREYVYAALALRISVITTTIVAISSVAETAVLATERIDVSGNVNFRKYLRSKLALFPILGFAYDAVYLTAVYFVVRYLSAIGAQPVSIAAAIALVALIVTIPLASYKWILSRRVVSLKFPLKSIASYTLAAAIMSLTILFLNPSEAISTEIGKVIFGIIPKIVAGGAVYILLITILDDEPRTIFKGLIRKIRRSA